MKGDEVGKLKGSESFKESKCFKGSKVEKVDKEKLIE
jgi:hypothetical protein